VSGLTGCQIVEDDRPETIARCLGQVLDLRQRLNGQEAARMLDESLLTQRVIEVYEQAIRDRY
jgi:hypothetical protein